MNAMSHVQTDAQRHSEGLSSALSQIMETIKETQVSTSSDKVNFQLSCKVNTDLLSFDKDMFCEKMLDRHRLISTGYKNMSTAAFSCRKLQFVLSFIIN